MPCGTLSSGVGAEQYLAIDTFQDSNGTALTSHTPNLGPAWTDDKSGDANLKIQGNQAAKTASGITGNTIQIDRATDFSASIDWIPTAAELSNSYEIFMILRVDSSGTNRYEIVLQGNGNFEIDTLFGATFTARTNVSIGALQAGVRYTIKASWSGNTVTCTVNGANTLTYTDSTNSSTGVFQGFVFNSNDSNQLSAQNWQITSP
jgi:hypothetical protein